MSRHYVWVAALVAAAFLSTAGQLAGAGGGGDGTSTEDAIGMEELEKLSHRQEITEGGFRDVRIGRAKDQVIEDLLTFGAAGVTPGPKDVVEATRPVDLARLRDAEGLVAASGAVTIEFDGDEVQRVMIAPTLPKWQSALHGVRTRSEVFHALEQLLGGAAALPVRRFAPDAHYVSLQKLTPQNHELLEKYDLWEISHDGALGYSHLDLEFERGSLVKIFVLESPSAL